MSRIGLIAIMLQNGGMKTKLFLISGWSFGRSALAALADSLQREFEVTRLAAEEVLLPGKLTEMLPANEPCVLVGWSLGGMLALQQADSLAAGSMLVLINSTAKFCSDPETPYGVPAAQLRSLAIAMRRQPEQTLANFYDQSAVPHAAIAQETCEPKDSKALLDGLTCLRNLDLREVAAKLQVPTLILYGDEDQVISPAASEELARLIRDSKQVIHHQVGHDLPIRESSRVATDILDFWNHDVVCSDAG